MGYIYQYQENYNTISPYVLSGGVLIEDAIKDMFENNVYLKTMKYVFLVIKIIDFIIKMI